MEHTFDDIAAALREPRTDLWAPVLRRKLALHAMKLGQN